MRVGCGSVVHCTGTAQRLIGTPRVVESFAATGSMSAAAHIQSIMRCCCRQSGPPDLACGCWLVATQVAMNDGPHLCIVVMLTCAATGQPNNKATTGNIAGQNMGLVARCHDLLQDCFQHRCGLVAEPVQRLSRIRRMHIWVTACQSCCGVCRGVQRGWQGRQTVHGTCP